METFKSEYMTTYSELTITFNEDLGGADTLMFKITDTQNASFITVTETWRSVRSGSNQVTVGSPTTVLGERSAINFKQAFNLDYNSTDIYEITRFSNNKVVIKSKNAYLQFSDASAVAKCKRYDLTATFGGVFTYLNCDGNTETLPLSLGATATIYAIDGSVSSFPPDPSGIVGYPLPILDVDFTYNNFTGTIFDITDVTILEADTDPCNNVKISVTTSEQANNITRPISQVVTTNPFVFTYQRDENYFDITMGKTRNTQSRRLLIPKLLSTYVDVQIINTPQQATANVILNSPLFQNQTINGVQYLLSFEYSLNDADWQISNSFTGLDVGNYTVYIRDNIGCKISIPFEVTEFTPNLVDYDAVSNISNLNSIRYKKDAVFSNCGTRKLVTNTLSYEERDKRPFRSFTQWVQKCDTLTTQIDSNYKTNTATLVDCEGNETPLGVTKMTDNMNKTDVRDGTVIYDAGTGLIGIRFGQGETYDPTTLLPNGSYNLGSLLMSWINVGDFVNLQGLGWTQIISISPPTDAIPYSVLYTSSFNNGFYPNGDVIQVSTVYNVVDFERYEFAVDATLLGGYYFVKVNKTDTKFGTISYTSEWLCIQEQHQKHFLIDYYNTVNNQINYSTGIRHRIRIPYVLQLKWKPNNTQDLYVTDTNTILLESQVRQFYDFNIAPLPTAMAQKVVLALSLDRLFIDGQSYLMEGEPETTPFGDTNLYQVKATLVKADYVFDTNSNIINQDIVIDGVPLAIIPNQKGMLFIN